METSLLSLCEEHATAKLAVSADTPVEQIWIPAPKVAKQFGVTRRTIGRWLLDVALGFPQPKIVKHRLYFERNSIDAWKTATAIKAAKVR